MARAMVPKRGWQRPGRLLVIAVVVAALLLLPQGRPFYATVGVITLLSLVLAVSIRPLLVGGEASFAHGAFYAIGAYTAAILTTKAHLPLGVALVAAALTAGIAAAIIGVPSLRTTGASFFIMTFGFMVLIMAVIQSATGLTGGVSGLAGVPSLSSNDPLVFYYVALGFAVLTTLVFAVLSYSRWGLELRAVGQDPALATAVGIGRTPLLLSSFVIGAVFAGVAGGLYASFITFVSISSFSFWLSVYVLTYVMVGGARHVLGPVVGTLILGFLPVSLSWSDTQSGLFTALLTLVILLVVPRGIVVSLLDRRRSAGPAAHDDVELLPEAPPAAAWQPSTPPPATAREVLRVDGVSKAFGGLQALDDVSFAVRAGEIVGLIGPNGAGKTTLFNIVSGFLPSDTGSVALGETTIGRLPAHHVVRHGLTRTFQASTVFAELTVLENVLTARGKAPRSLRHRLVLPVGRDKAAQEEASSILRRLGLERWSAEMAGSLPYGIRRAVGVAVAMATKPAILCLDEPLAGLSEGEAEHMIEVVRRLRREEGLTVLIIEHRLRHIAELCDRFIALDLGRLIADGSPEAVLADPEIVRAYLGGPLEGSAHV